MAVSSPLNGPGILGGKTAPRMAIRGARLPMCNLSSDLHRERDSSRDPFLFGASHSMLRL